MGRNTSTRKVGMRTHSPLALKGVGKMLPVTQPKRRPFMKARMKARMILNPKDKPLVSLI